jgi:hypothetical protein
MTMMMMMMMMMREVNGKQLSKDHGTERGMRGR